MFYFHRLGGHTGFILDSKQYGRKATLFFSKETTGAKSARDISGGTTTGKAGIKIRGRTKGENR
jgi:hypothetical protein